MLDRLLQMATEGDGLAHELVYRLWRYGVTSSLGNDLQKNVRGIQYDTHPKFDSESGKFYWHRELALEQDVPLLSAYSMIIVLAVNSGQALQVKRCEGMKKVGDNWQTCGNFYVGADNKLYCSETCASRARVQAKRKRDRESGML